VFGHAGFAIKGYEARRETLVGNVGVLLLVFEDVADPAEALGASEAPHCVLVDAGFFAEAVDVGSFLELLHHIL